MPPAPRASALTLGLRADVADDARADIVIPPSADSPRGERADFGSSSHGRHGRDREDDDDDAVAFAGGRSFGRQHGSHGALTVLAEAEAQSIPIRDGFSVHAGEYSGSYVRGADGAFVRADGGGASAGTSGSPRVVVVHSADVDADAGSIGCAGRRNHRGSFNSLIMLEANALSRSQQ